jgi:Bacterial Ig-like domain
MRILHVLVAFALVFAGVVSTVGSGGGGGGGGEADTTPPNIISFSPPNNATFIDQAATVSVTFDELINKSSITTESFVLRDQSNRQVSGKMEITTLHNIINYDFFDYTKIRFVPDTRLQDSTDYHVLVGTGMKDKAGNHLSNETTWTFTTAPGGSGTWTATSLTNEPDRREGHTAIWTGTEMIVWGGIGLNGSEYIYLDDGARYNPATDTWQSISPLGAPSARSEYSAVWTGSEMLIWGGRTLDRPLTFPLACARYNPASDKWQSMSTVNVPTGRAGHGAVWTGTEMIVWGGINYQSSALYFSSGGRYDPIADSWVPTSSQNAPTGRVGESIVWTGNEMIVWGGHDDFE